MMVVSAQNKINDQREVVLFIGLSNSEKWN